MKKRNKIFAILALVWMIFIFSMSAQSADESTNTSLRAGRLVCTLFVPHYKNMTASDQMALAEKIDHPVRKTAHATEYAVLGILLFFAIPGNRYVLSLFIAAVYASTDEFHQLFVPGRSGQITDVLIDSCGAIAGLLLLFLLHLRSHH
ncbi:MAG: VanZ family protein [Lachnospiraceae bacterium]|nr:VanZ family protein [Lachnospiraceae bacterium]